MRPITKLGQAHLIKRNGNIIEAGEDTADPQISEDGVVDEVVWFEATDSLSAFGVRETNAEVKAWREGIAYINLLAKVEALKTDIEYRQKAIESKDILSGTAYDPNVHKFVAIEVAETGQTGLEAAQSIENAIYGDATVSEALAIAQQRIALRQQLTTESHVIHTID